MTSDEEIQRYIDKWKDIQPVTTDHVREILVDIGPPHKRQDIKYAVVDKLFIRKSKQGHTTADDLVNYPEY